MTEFLVYASPPVRILRVFRWKYRRIRSALLVTCIRFPRLHVGLYIYCYFGVCATLVRSLNRFNKVHRIVLLRAETNGFFIGQLRSVADGDMKEPRSRYVLDDIPAPNVTPKRRVTHVTLAASAGISGMSVHFTSRCSTETAKRRITQTTPHDSAGTLVFWCWKSLQKSNGVTQGRRQMQAGYAAAIWRLSTRSVVKLTR